MDITTLTFNELLLLGDENLTKALKGAEEKQIKRREDEMSAYSCKYVYVYRQFR